MNKTGHGRLYLVMAVIFFAVMACTRTYQDAPMVPTATPMTLPAPAMTSTPTPKVATVSAAHALYIREASGVMARIIGYLPHDSRVLVMGSCDAIGWRRIAVMDTLRTGWVNADYLKEGCQ